MKFVHLTDRDNISRIKKDGIRTGRGFRGRGVYSVPLLKIHGVTDAMDFERSTGVAWKILFRGKELRSYRGKRPVAITFEAPATAWVADLHLFCHDDEFSSFFEACEQNAVGDLYQPDADWTEFEGFRFRTFRVKSTTEVGKVVAAWEKTVVHKRDLFYGGVIELVFRQSIPSSAICRIDALNATNQSHKQRRDRYSDHGD